MSIVKPHRIGGLIGSIPNTVSGVYGLTKLSEINFPFAIGGDTYTYIQDAKYWRCHMFSQVGSDTLTFLRGGLVEYLVVGGGGSGGQYYGSGGGGGGFRQGTFFVAANAKQITVGGGGSFQNSGGNSVFADIIAAGGGFGTNGGGSTVGSPASSGGSGGGGGSTSGRTAGAAGNTPSVSPPQGSDGGSSAGPSGNYGSGGGGGASSAGGSGGSNGGSGGSGQSSQISGASLTYAGGGGGSVGGSGIAGSGGSGGGGKGAKYSGASVVDGNTGGEPFTGGGAGGGGASVSGGSGIVIVRYQITQAEFEGDEPYYDNVSLLLHMNGSNGSTTFADSSKHRHAVTAYGDAQISTTQSKFGGASGAFDGTGDYLTVPNNAAFQFGGGDFTIEAYIYLNAGSAIQRIYSQLQDGNNQTYFSVTASNKLSFETYFSSVSRAITSSSSVPIGEWFHAAASRSGTTWRVFINGTKEGEQTYNFTIPELTADIFISTWNGSSQPLNGYIDDLRITKGVARYTGNFTPPQREFLP